MKNKEYVESIIIRKETQFMEEYRQNLQGLYDKVGISSEKMRIDDLIRISQRLVKSFFGELIRDEEFLNQEIKEHFHLPDGTHVFCLEIVAMPEKCHECNNIVSEWLAIVVNTDLKVFDIGYVRCDSINRVADSSYRGFTLHEVVALLKGNNMY